MISGYDVEVGIVFIRLTEMIEIQFGEYLGISRKQKNLELQQYIYTMLRFRKDIYHCTNFTNIPTNITSLK